MLLPLHGEIKIFIKVR